jgi:hypothetical protein
MHVPRLKIRKKTCGIKNKSGLLEWRMDVMLARCCWRQTNKPNRSIKYSLRRCWIKAICSILRCNFGKTPNRNTHIPTELIAFKSGEKWTFCTCSENDVMCRELWPEAMKRCTRRVRTDKLVCAIKNGCAASKYIRISKNDFFLARRRMRRCTCWQLNLIYAIEQNGVKVTFCWCATCDYI